MNLNLTLLHHYDHYLLYNSVLFDFFGRYDEINRDLIQDGLCGRVNVLSCVGDHVAIRPSILRVSSDLRVHAHYLSWPRRKASITRTVLELGEPAAVFPCCIAAGCSPEIETSARIIPFLYF